MTVGNILLHLFLDLQNVFIYLLNFSDGCQDPFV